MKILKIVIILSVSFSCSKEPKKWNYKETISINNISPIGIAPAEKGLWISDGDHNKLINISASGKILDSIIGFERPMHIESIQNKIYVPEYGEDRLTFIQNKEKSQIPIDIKMDGPSGVAIFENQIGIADFYNHQVLFFNGKDWLAFGKKGNKEGEFHYPTDIQILKDKIIVADAYNHRVQILDKQGNFLQFIGENDAMNATTGLFVTKKQIIATDFENNRVLIYSHKGKLLQTITNSLKKPTDILMHQNNLYITNYAGNSIAVYE